MRALRQSARIAALVSAGLMISAEARRYYCQYSCGILNRPFSRQHPRLAGISPRHPPGPSGGDSGGPRKRPKKNPPTREKSLSIAEAPPYIPPQTQYARASRPQAHGTPALLHNGAI